MNQEKTGQFIAKCRKEANLTQKQLSEILNVNEKTVSKWERGVNAPDISLLIQLSESLNVSVNEILAGEKEKNINNSKKIIEDNLTIETLKYYTKKIKFKVLKLTATIIMIILFIFATLFTINNYNQYKVYSVRSNHSQFETYGYIIYNQEKNIIVMKPLIYADKYVGTTKETKALSVELSLILDNKILYKETEESTELKRISEFLKNSCIFLEEDIKASEYIIENEKSIKELKIKILYQINEDEYKEIILPLEINEIYSNNKLFY